MFDSTFNHALRRTICMPRCSDEQLQYEVSTISEKLARRESRCEDVRPTYSWSIASMSI